jgi:hypothetical protein
MCFLFAAIGSRSRALVGIRQQRRNLSKKMKNLSRGRRRFLVFSGTKARKEEHGSRALVVKKKLKTDMGTGADVEDAGQRKHSQREKHPPPRCDSETEPKPDSISYVTSGLENSNRSCSFCVPAW